MNLDPSMNCCLYFWYTQRTWSLEEDFNRGHDMEPYACPSHGPAMLKKSSVEQPLTSSSQHVVLLRLTYLEPEVCNEPRRENSTPCAVSPVFCPEAPGKYRSGKQPRAAAR